MIGLFILIDNHGNAWHRCVESQDGLHDCVLFACFVDKPDTYDEAKEKADEIVDRLVDTDEKAISFSDRSIHWIPCTSVAHLCHGGRA